MGLSWLRTRSTFLCAVLVLTLCILLVAGWRLSSSQTRATQVIPVAVSEGYILKDLNGYVTVYRTSSSEPYEKTDIPTLSLPKADRSALMTGIELPDRASVEQLLEDYQG